MADPAFCCAPAEGLEGPPQDASPPSGPGPMENTPDNELSPLAASNLGSEEVDFGPEFRLSRAWDRGMRFEQLQGTKKEGVALERLLRAKGLEPDLRAGDAATVEAVRGARRPL